jgi:hypothetical protein
LNIIVTDADVSLNAEYELRIEDVENSLGVFSVYPKLASGRFEDRLNDRRFLTLSNSSCIRTPVIIRVENPARLDYEREEGRHFVFKVNALQGIVKQFQCNEKLLTTDIFVGQQILSSVTVTVLVTDANDNVPIFDRQVYLFKIREDSSPGAQVGKEEQTHLNAN